MKVEDETVVRPLGKQSKPKKKSLARRVRDLEAAVERLQARDAARGLAGMVIGGPRRD